MAIPRAKRQSTLNVAGAVEKMAEAQREVLPPSDTVLDDEEMRYWRQFTSVRPPSNWSQSDLIVLARIARFEKRIRFYERQLDAEGAIVTNQRGTDIANPLIGALSDWTRLQLSLMRALSMTVAAEEPRTLAGQAKQVSKAKASLHAIGNHDLLAQPD
jgi:phage terminase small subunit